MSAAFNWKAYVLDFILVMWLFVWISLFIGSASSREGGGEALGMLGALIVWPTGIFIGIVGIVSLIALKVRNRKFSSLHKTTRSILIFLDMGGIFLTGMFIVYIVSMFN